MSAWVLLRGLARESGHWGRFADLLARRLPDTPLVMPDLPGNGALFDALSPTRIEDMVHACRIQLTQQGLTPPFQLFGLSMGGMVVVEWARQHPDEVTCGVLVNASVRPFGSIHQRLRPSAWPTLVRILAGRDARSIESAVLRLTSGSPELHSLVVDEWIELRMRHPVARSNALRQLFAAARYRATSRPQPPLLVLSSEGDALVDPGCSRRLAQAWGTALAIHPSAGHDLPLDDPLWVIERMLVPIGRRRSGPA